MSVYHNCTLDMYVNIETWVVYDHVCVWSGFTCSAVDDGELHATCCCSVSEEVDEGCS